MLNRLSLDAIVAITNELEGRDIARLWICGDALLNHRLGRGGGVKKVFSNFRLSLSRYLAINRPLFC